MRKFFVKPVLVESTFTAHFTPDLTEEAYHLDKTAVSSTWLPAILKSPYHFLHREVEETEPMRFGTAFHMALLQKERFDKLFVIEPEFSGKGSVALRNDWRTSLPPGAVTLKSEKHADLMGMIESVKAHPQAFRILRDSQTELSGYFRDPLTGIKCRMRCDFFQESVMILGDVKSCMDCSENAFSRTIWERKYYLQLYFYCLGMEQITGRKVKYPLFLAVEKAAPFECAVYIADDEMMKKGKEDFEKCMSILKTCIETDRWNRYQSELKSISLPYWASKESF